MIYTVYVLVQRRMLVQPAAKADLFPTVFRNRTDGPADPTRGSGIGHRTLGFSAHANCLPSILCVR